MILRNFDKHYMGHNLDIDLNELVNFDGTPLICVKCKIKYLTYDSEPKFQLRSLFMQFENLTCEEVIIKKIIE
jgi:hypothetical protein